MILYTNSSNFASQRSRDSIDSLNFGVTARLGPSADPRHLAAPKRPSAPRRIATPKRPSAPRRIATPKRLPRSPTHCFPAPRRAPLFQLEPSNTLSDVISMVSVLLLFLLRRSLTFLMLSSSYSSPSPSPCSSASRSSLVTSGCA